jgi:hypothetical protein
MFFSTLQTNRDVSVSTFFALHRLIVHVENGESVRRSLVFDQGQNFIINTQSEFVVLISL